MRLLLTDYIISVLSEKFLMNNKKSGNNHGIQKQENVFPVGPLIMNCQGIVYKRPQRAFLVIHV